MIPLRDHGPTRTGVPFVTWALIAANAAVFLYQVVLAAEAPQLERALIYSLGVVPERVWAAATGTQPELAVVLSMITSMFLHGGWMHLIGNLWFLWIFGDNVEDALGHGVFLVFYVGCGVVAASTQVLADPGSSIPMVGASGAIAGVMGAYLIRFPRARITVLVPIIVFWTTFEVPAFVMLSIWLVIQVLSGTGAASGGVAWWAHIGGFLAGMAFLLIRTRTRYRSRRGSR